MKYLYTLLLTCLVALGLQAQTNNSLNMSEVSRWRDPNLSRYYANCWGYAANGREYGIIGSNWGTHFIDITTPGQAIEVASFAGMDTDVIWREYKVYGHYAYGVADGGNNSLQIFDLSGLPDSVTKVYDSQALTRSAHTVSIDNDKLYLNINRRPAGGVGAVDIFSLADPINPTFLGSISSSAFNAVHDLHVRNDTAYCSAEYAGLFIYNVQNPAAPQLISSITSYPAQGYNHSSWTDASARTLIFADEVPKGRPLKLYDISDIQNPVFRTTFESNPGATPHNPYILGNHVVVAYYMDGVQVFDIANPNNPVRVGFYDTYPDNVDYSGGAYEGCWGVYPYLPSGNIIASDITYGLFVVTNPYTVNSTNELNTNARLKVFPNPAKDQFAITLPEYSSNPTFELINSIGQHQLIKPTIQGQTAVFNTTGLPAGLYTVRVAYAGKIQATKVVIK